MNDNRLHVLSAFGEQIPLAARSVDVVYARQVLHHTRDLNGALQECARILRTGGVFLATREHVANSDAELAAFLAVHPIHQLAGGEHAYPLAPYIRAIEHACLLLQRVIGPWDSVINAFPAVKTQAELETLAARKLRSRFGSFGGAIGTIPGVQRLVRSHIQRPVPGAIYSFLARKL